MNLLIVDDEIITVQGILHGVNWSELNFKHLFSCTEIDEAKEYFSKYKIDIMLCDIEMPEETGLEFLEWVRNNNFETECIFLTCHDEFLFVQKAMKLRAYDYILKPIPYDELKSLLLKVKKFVAKRKQLEKYQEYGKETITNMINDEEQPTKNTKIIIEKVKKYIQKNLSEELSAELLAKEVFISTDYLFRIFKKEEKMTLVEYITQERMFCAIELLKDPKVSVTQVASSIGFNNYYYFSRIFKKVYGKTPSEYHREFITKYN